MRLDRTALELRERNTLAPYATLAGESRGRVTAEPEPQYRTAFQRDRDRVLHSAAFRRLEYKTQVFVNDEGDYYRTRLTHTLEVAQIGRTIARALAVNEDLVEAIALAHDLGHPPFGHAGEDALNRVMAGQGGFNHNLQTYRVLTELEHRYPGWRGLNLSAETLHGVVTHETTVDVQAAAGLDLELGPSLEAQIADFSDELAYAAHDLDDGISAGLITPQMLPELSIWREVCARRDWPVDAAVVDEVRRHILVREVVGLLVDDVTEGASALLDVLAPESAVAVQRLPERVLRYSASVGRLARELRAFLYEQMYRHHRVIRMQRRAERFVEEIFEALCADPRQLPPEFRHEAEWLPVERVVSDYIAGMTDRGALLEYRRLFDPLTRP